MPRSRTLSVPPAWAALAVALAVAVVTGPAAPGSAEAQTFVRIRDAANPVSNDAGGPGFSGASWIDVDFDGDDDLFVSNVALYRNLGGGAFAREPIAGNTGGLGNSWADLDNDGDADLMMAGGSAARGTRLFRNDGGAGGFTLVTAGATSDSLGNAGWACAWGDYDADGFADAVIAAPFGFTGANPNRLLRNAGAGTFVQDTSTDVTVGTAPYTVPSWCDFDQDGDLDLSIGAGPANGSKGVDYFYKNTRIEGGSPLLDRFLGVPLTNDVRDGQIVNWPDYDNDGDFDCYITNYRQSSNHLYRNDAGAFVRMVGFDVGPIAGDVGWNLASCWGDYDNDGDQDCFVVRTSGFPNRYYRNENNGTFTSVAMDTMTLTPGTSAVTADYDGDGDLDLYVAAPGQAAKGLYRNDLAAGNHWFKVRLEGTQSNRSAIGAKVRVRATIGGVSVTQLREVSSQNSFNGHSSLAQHFGLGDATVVERMEIRWPRGLVETFTNLTADQAVLAVEGSGLPTPTLAELIASRLTSRGLELQWSGSALEPGRAYVQRRAAGEDAWIALGPAASAGPHSVTYVDATVVPGDWAYRLSDGAAGGAWLSDEALVAVPAVAAEAPRLALRALAPVALGGRVRLEMTLPSDGAARAEVFDARGRRAFVEDLGARAAGTHVVDLAMPVPGAGVYWVRLAQGGEVVTARAVVLGAR